MKTSTQWPAWRDPSEKEHDPGRVFWSVFPDVVGEWSVADWGGELEQREGQG